MLSSLITPVRRWLKADFETMSAYNKNAFWGSVGVLGVILAEVVVCSLLGVSMTYGVGLWIFKTTATAPFATCAVATLVGGTKMLLETIRTWHEDKDLQGLKYGSAMFVIGFVCVAIVYVFITV